MGSSSGRWMIEDLNSLSSPDTRQIFVEVVRNSSGYWIVEMNSDDSSSEENSIAEEKTSHFDEKADDDLKKASDDNLMEVEKLIEDSSDNAEESTNNQRDSSSMTSQESLPKVDNYKADNTKPKDDLLTAVTEGNLTEVMRIVNSVGLAHNPLWLNGYQPLRLAIKNHHKEIVDFLLENNAQVNSTAKKSRNTPLHLSTLTNNEEIVEMLLINKAVCQENLINETPIDFAIKINSMTILKLFVKYLSDLDISEESYSKLFVYFYNNEHYPLAEKLLTQCPHMNLQKALDDSNIFFRAIDKQQYSIVEKLLEHGADVNSINHSNQGFCTALFMACERNNIQLVKLLLSKGADADLVSEIIKWGTTFRYYPIQIAMESPHFLMVQMILDHINDIDKLYGEFSPLHMACNFGNEEVVKLLLQRGANINIKNDLGLMAISYAASRKYFDIFKFLIENEDLVLDYNNVKIILLTATKSYSSKMLLMVMEYINELDHKDNLRYEIDSKVFNNSEEYSLLHTAARFNAHECLEILIQNGALVDGEDKFGKTALHVAYQFGRDQAVVTLLKNGANVNVICKKSYVPFDYLRISHLGEKLGDPIDECVYDDEKNDVLLEGCNVELMISSFVKLIAMMKALGLYVNEYNYEAFSAFKYREHSSVQYPKSYSKDIEVLKTTVIVPESTVTYYHFLKSSLSGLVYILEDKNILDMLKTEDYNLIFGNYSPIISGCFKRALTRKNLLDETEKYPIFDYIQELPDLCIEKIINYFSDCDLKDLINQFKFFDNQSE